MSSTTPSSAQKLHYSEIARTLGIPRQQVWAWFQPGRQIPARWVIPFEKATGVSRHELRADLYPPADTEAA